MSVSMPSKLRRLGCVLAVCASLSGCASAPIASPTLVAHALQPLDAKALGLRNLISFDVYAEGSNVHAVMAAETADRKKPYIAYLHSDDGGLHWAAPIEIAHHLPAALESRIGNDLQVAASGDRLLVVWQLSGDLPGMGPLATLYSLDGGKQWQAGSPPGASDIDQSHADLAADSQGRFHLVWLDDRDENGYQGLRYARSSDTGGQWELQQTIDDSSCSCCWNRLVISPDDRLHVLYRDMEPRDMALAQSFDAGQHWQRTATVGEFDWQFNGCPHNGGALAHADDQTWHGLVWTGADHKVGLYHLQSADAGRHWSAPRAMGDGAKAFHSDLAIDADGAVVAIWDELGNEGSRVVFSQSQDHGEPWLVPQLLSAAEASASFPRVLATEAGILALWMEQKTGEYKQWRAALLQ